MFNESNKKTRKGIWINYEASLTPYGCANFVERNKPLQEVMIKVFSYILEKLFILCNRNKGIHLFLNPGLDEIHYIYREFMKNQTIVSYKNIKNSGVGKWLKEQIIDSKEGINIPQIRNISEGNLKNFFDKIKFENTQDRLQCLILPFDYGKINLGIFIIWGERNPKRKCKEVSDHTLLGWIAAWYSFLSKLFIREYRVEKNTYLPSYCSIGWKRTAILFADIRNFTPMTEMLRNAYSYKKDDPGPLQQIVNEYCSEMSKIIQEQNRGRIDKFLGDGIMAIFGEYDYHPSKIACRAVYVACQMVKKFREIKKGWEEKAFGKGYDIEFNETVEIDIGIGIDFGTVLFDYLGDDVHREYSAVGDHVNFAQSLQGDASKKDEITQKKRPPILISRTVFRCCSPWLKNYSEVKLTPKGKGYEYICYGIESEGFNEAHFHTCETGDNWEVTWQKHEDGSPLCFPIL